MCDEDWRHACLTPGGLSPCKEPQSPGGGRLSEGNDSSRQGQSSFEPLQISRRNDYDGGLLALTS